MISASELKLDNDTLKNDLAKFSSEKLLDNIFQLLVAKIENERNAKAYIVYNTDKVNSILTICLSTLSGSEMEILKDALIERLQKKLI